MSGPAFTIKEFGSKFGPGGVSSGYPADAPNCYECGHHADEHLLTGAAKPADPGARFECIHDDCLCQDFRRAPHHRRR